jgi:amino acid transporter
MDASSLMQLFVFVLVVGSVIAIGLYVLSRSPIEEPYKGWIRWGVLAIVCIFIMYWLLSLVGVAPPIRLK